jgi:KDO2-lipid IV(A) lauroyltransferase
MGLMQPVKKRILFAVYKLSLTASGLAGRMLGFASPGVRRRMEQVYGAVFQFDQPGLKKVTDNFFADYSRNKIEVFFYPFMGESTIRHFVTLEGEEHLQAALARGKGAVLAHTHMSNPQMLMPALGHRRYKLWQVGMTPMDVYHGVREITGGRPNLPAYIWLSIKDRLERSLPVTFIHIGRQPLKEVFRKLSEGALVAMTVDGVKEGDGVREFFGKKTGMFTSGPVRVALRSGAALLPLFVLREEDGRCRVVIEAPVEMNRNDDRQDAVEKAMAEFLRRFEGHLRKYPWLYGRFLGFHNDRFFLPGD